MKNRIMGIVALFCCLILLVPSSSAKRGEGKLNTTVGCGFNDNLLATNARSPHDTAADFIWANGKIPYYFKLQTSDGDKNLLRSIIREVEEHTCFKFMERGQEPVNEHHLEVEVGTASCGPNGFMAYVTPLSYQKMLLKSFFQLTDDDRCNNRGGLLHELIHALGVGHTQKRADRDKYIRVIEDNIQDGRESQYGICSGCKVYDEIPYDCNSIMHYGTGTFRKKGSGPTMEARDSVTCKLSYSGPAFTIGKAADTDWKLLKLISSKVCSNGKATDGQWSLWSSYTECSATCGEATKTRERSCSDPPPSNGGKNCQGEEKQVVKCKLPQCGGSCSYTNKYSATDCEKYMRDGDCTSEEWKGWMSENCAKTCKCEGINISAIDGQWSPWSSHSECSATCGEATKIQKRSCSNPPPSNGGKNCQGEEKQVVKCELPQCAIDGQWSPWSSYTKCSTTCGEATKTRERSCSDPPPSNGGKICEGEEKQIIKCKLPQCDGSCSYTNEYSTTDCEYWKRNGECTSEKFKGWMSKNCAKTCKCEDDSCAYTDLSDKCASYKDKYCCHKEHAKWMNNNCAKTCKCGGSCCPNKRSDCNKLNKHCKSKKWGTWMDINCSTTCHCNRT